MYTYITIIYANSYVHIYIYIYICICCMLLRNILTDVRARTPTHARPAGRSAGLRPMPVLGATQTNK